VGAAPSPAAGVALAPPSPPALPPPPMFLTWLTRRSTTAASTEMPAAAAETPARPSRTGAVATEHLATTTLVAATTAAAPATATSADLGADVTRVVAKGTTWRVSVKLSAEAAEVAAGKPPAPCATPPPAYPVATYATTAARAVAVVLGTAAPIPTAVSASGAADEDARTTTIDAATAALGSTPATNARAHRGIPPSPSPTEVAWTNSLRAIAAANGCADNISSDGELVLRPRRLPPPPPPPLLAPLPLRLTGTAIPLVAAPFAATPRRRAADAESGRSTEAERRWSSERRRAPPSPPSPPSPPTMKAAVAGVATSTARSSESVASPPPPLVGAAPNVPAAQRRQRRRQRWRRRRWRPTWPPAHAASTGSLSECRLGRRVCEGEDLYGGGSARNMQGTQNYRRKKHASDSKQYTK